MGDTFPNHNNNSYYRSPTFYYTGTLDPLGWAFTRAFGAAMAPMKAMKAATKAGAAMKAAMKAMKAGLLFLGFRVEG